MTPRTDGLRCHALRVRLEPPVDPHAITGLLGPAARLWTESLPLAHDDDQAERRRQAELGRPVPADGQARAVLLCFADGVADLVLVARRDDLDYRGLHELAGRAAGEDKPWQAEPSIPPVRCDWGLGDGRDDGHIASFEPADETGLFAGDRQDWLGALALTLSRYDDSAEPVLAVADTDGLVSLLRAQVPEDARLGELGRTDPDSASRWSGAGLQFTLASSGYEYRAFLAPPFPLTLRVTSDGDGQGRLGCWYRPGIVAPEMAAQFTRHLLTARRQAQEFPDQRVSQTQLVEPPRPGPQPSPATSPETGPGTGPEGDSIHQRFAARAGEHPERLAVSGPAGPLSYAELDRRSTRLARGLRALGVGRGDRVGICLDRTAELVEAILAVLKAGAVYVPMDPAYPASRLTFMLEDSGAAVVISELDDLPAARTAARTVSMAELAALSEPNGTSPPGSPGTAAGPSDPAYIIYTSGSTGRPKGVVIPHGNVTSLIDATEPDYALGPDDVWTLFHSCAFDFSVWEIWGCLLTGGRLVVVPYWESRAPDRFAALLADERVTVLSQTPSAFAQLIEADRGRPPDLAVRLVVLGGEALSPRVLIPWLDRYPESACAVVNMFGITETTVHVTAQPIARRHALGHSRSIGRPLPGWQVYVLDRRGRLTPPGVRGEIYVGGAGAAQCYLGRPDLTGQRFVADPFAGSSAGGTGRRMYRSGDGGRLRPDGTLEYHGRLDDQIKLRGFRIEPAEIRAALLEYPLISDAAVVPHHDDRSGGAGDRIDAYVVLGGGTADDVRQHAARSLPGHMVPATVTAVPALPLTANGKLEAARLPLPLLRATSAPAAPEDDPAEPADGLAGRLATIWTDVLDTSVRLDDNFFDLGGNSLLAVRLVGAMRERGLARLPLRDLYRHPTVRKLAGLLGDPAAAQARLTSGQGA